MEMFESRQDIIKFLSQLLFDYVNTAPKENIFKNMSAIQTLVSSIDYLEKQEHEFLWEENKRMHREIETLSRKKREIQEKVYNLEDELNSLSQDTINKMQ